MSIYPDGFNINNFIANLGRDGIAHANRYSISFSGTKQGGLGFSRENQERMNSRLESVSLPSETIGSNPVKLQGIDREIPYGRIYEGDVKLVFLDDKRLGIRSMFETWHNFIVDRNTFQLSYYDSYVVDMYIFVNEITNRQNPDAGYAVKLFDVFPKTINSVELSASSEELIKTDIDMSFRKWVQVNPSTLEEAIGFRASGDRG